MKVLYYINMEQEPAQKPPEDWLSLLIKKYPEAEAGATRTGGEVIIHTHFADGRKVDRRLSGGDAVFRDTAGRPIVLSTREEIEIILKCYPKVNSWFEIDLSSELEALRKEEEQEKQKSKEGGAEK
jgi:hypothetical protein